MPFSLLIHDAAHHEYINAYEWYETRQSGLGDRFMNAVENTIQLIIQKPEHFARYKGNYRTAKVKGFPYVLVFEIFRNQKLVHLAAVFHGKRKPSKKFRRLKS